MKRSGFKRKAKKKPLKGKDRAAKIKKTARPVKIHLLRERACNLIKKYVKALADVDGYCKCVTCCKMVKNGTIDCHGGHYQHGKNKATYLMERNIHVQCMRCNHSLNGNSDKYTLFMLDKYGREVVDFLIELNKKPYIFKKTELYDTIDEYKKKLEDLK